MCVLSITEHFCLQNIVKRQGGEMWGGNVSLSTGEGSWEGQCLLPKIFLGGFWGQNGVFSWTLGAKFRFSFYDQNSIEIHQEYKDCRGD